MATVRLGCRRRIAFNSIPLACARTRWTATVPYERKPCMKLVFTLICCAFLFALSACSPERLGNAPPLVVGSKHTSAVKIGRVTFPLPEGEWTVMASRVTRSNMIDGSLAGGMGHAVLGRLVPTGTSSALDAVIQIQANLDAQNVRWQRDASCFREDWLFVENRFAHEGDQRCLYVRAWNTNFQYNENWAPVERDAVDWARANNVQLGLRTFLGTRYRIVRSQDIAIIWYYFSNSALGVMTSDNQWHPVARQQRPDFDRAFQRHLDWSRQWEQQVLAGVEGRLVAPSRQPAVSAPLPNNVQPQDRATRLRELESLRSQGLISQDEFNMRRQRILEGL